MLLGILCKRRITAAPHAEALRATTERRARDVFRYVLAHEHRHFAQRDGACAERVERGEFLGPCMAMRVRFLPEQASRCGEKGGTGEG